MFIVLGIYKFGCSLECRDQKVSSKAQTSGFEIALLHEKFSPGLIFLHANMHNTQKFPREKTLPKIRLNLSMPLLLWPGLVEYMGARGIVPTTFWQDFQISLQFDTKCFSILSLRPHQILRPSAVPALYEGRWREICVWPLLFQHILVLLNKYQSAYACRILGSNNSITLRVKAHFLNWVSFKYSSKRIEIKLN